MQRPLLEAPVVGGARPPRLRHPRILARRPNSSRARSPAGRVRAHLRRGAPSWVSKQHVEGVDPRAGSIISRPAGWKFDSGARSERGRRVEVGRHLRPCAEASAAVARNSRTPPTTVASQRTTSTRPPRSARGRPGARRGSRPARSHPGAAPELGDEGCERLGERVLHVGLGRTARAGGGGGGRPRGSGTTGTRPTTSVQSSPTTSRTAARARRRRGSGRRS